MPFKINGSIIQEHVRLWWKPVRNAKLYSIQWMCEDRKWVSVEHLEGDEIRPNQRGHLEFVDEYPGPMGPGGTYRVSAHFDALFEGNNVASLPIKLSATKALRTTKPDLLRRLKRRRTPANLKALFAKLKYSPHGWKMILPKNTMCLGKRIEVKVLSPQLTDSVIDLLATIFENLPKLAKRTEKAFNDIGGPGALDESDQISRPCILIDPERQTGRSAGKWTMIVGVKGSDYAWNIEFIRARFKEIWSGD